MKESFTDLLRCPRTGNPLTLKNARIQLGEVIDGELVEPSGHRYPILKGIPRFVDSDQYVANFSLEWTAHKKTQIDTTEWAESEKSFDTIMRWGLIAVLAPAVHGDRDVFWR